MYGTVPHQCWQDQGINWDLAVETSEACDTSDDLIVSHADTEASCQPAVSSVFIDIAAAAHGAARRTNLPSSGADNANPVVRGRAKIGLMVGCTTWRHQTRQRKVKRCNPGSSLKGREGGERWIAGTSSVLVPDSRDG